MVLLTGLGQQFQQVWVGAEVQGGLVLLVLDVEVGAVRGKEDSDGSAALLGRVAHHQSLGVH